MVWYVCLMVHAVLAAPVLDIDFNEAGFTDGADIGGIENMTAQPGSWSAYDTDGTGYAAGTSSWGRAENYASFTLDVGHSVMIETTLRLSDADGSYVNSEGFMIGFAESSQHTGNNIPTVGSKLYTYSDGSYWFGGDDPVNRLSVGASDNGDWIRFTQWITRSAASNAFSGIISATNLTDGADLGSTSLAWTQTTSDGSWGGTIQPGFRVLMNAGVTALEIDRWTVSTMTNPPPVVTNPPPAVVTNTAVVTVDLTRRRSIAGTTALDREQWFGVYHETGYARTQFTDGGQTMSFDEWINEEGRMWPSRGTVKFDNMAEDLPTRPTYVDPSEFSSLNNLFDWRYAWAKSVAPDHKTVMSGEGHGKYPAYMCWDPVLTHNVKTVSNNVAHAEAIVRILAQLDSRNGLMPYWFEVMNESSIQNNYGWHWDSDAWDKLSEFHAKVGEAVRASVYSNVVKVAGPTDAYPFRDDSDGDFSQWEGSNKKFIQLAGDKMDAYAIHTYEQMTTNSTGNSSFDDQFSRFEIWHQGRLPSFIDLWETEHNVVHGGTLPFVFSEYGLLNNQNPYGDENAYYQLRSCNGILLSLLDRPDVVDKMSAFLMSQAPYNWNQKRVFFASNNSGASFYKTSYFEYLRFWHDLEGDYLFSSVDSQHLALHAFLDDSTLFIVMKNNHNMTYELDMQSQLPSGATVSSAQIQRLYYNGVDDVARDPFTVVSDLSSVFINPDETIMLKMQLTGMPDLLTWHERNVYSDRTLVPMGEGSPESFTFDLPGSSVEPFSEGVVHVSLYSFNGFANPLSEVAVNGTVVTNVPDVSYSAGAPRSWKQIKVPIPAGILQKGSNTVTITPSESGFQKKITSVRLTVTGAIGDEDTDGMPDWWELDNDLDPWVNDAAAHADADGVNNGDEFIALTDPQDAQSVLTTYGDADPAGYRISIDSESDRLYAFETTEDLQASWADLTNGIPGDGELLEISDDDGKTNRFYRVRVEME